MTTTSLPIGTRCMNATTRLMATAINAPDVIVPDGMTVLAIERTGVRRLARCNGTTNRYGQRNLDLFEINTTVIDGACWGTIGRKAGTIAIME